jgi:two-component system sensor histidine kinase UhpB
VLSGFAVVSALLICAAVGRALRLLERMSAAFGRIAQGDYDPRMPERGPAELAELARGFNRMAQQLATVAAQNRRLNARLLSLQAEERADLARDLHDEVGPLLFAVDMTAATIERLAVGGRSSEVPLHVRSIHDAVGRMQRHVRSILERLRPLEETGLQVAIDRLVSFWRGRRPEIDFGASVLIDEERLGETGRQTIYRVVQEAMSNAIRHGAPRRVDVVVTHDGDDGVRVAVTDDGVGLPEDAAPDRGAARFGLVGMRERVTAMDGALSLRPGRDGKGVALVARLPCAPASEQEMLP